MGATARCVGTIRQIHGPPGFQRAVNDAPVRACSIGSPRMVFPADGTSLVGRVYRNVDDLVTPQPAVVITGAWLTVKEQMARTYALRLAEQGITAFTFDFTGFGQSGGAPRQLELPARKIADVAAASDFLSTMSFVSEGGVGYLGICASASTRWRRLRVARESARS
jgi:fermentation-respiration switch protein FrsA (DUF1100 family)